MSERNNGFRRKSNRAYGTDRRMRVNGNNAIKPAYEADYEYPVRERARRRRIKPRKEITVKFIDPQSVFDSIVMIAAVVIIGFLCAKYVAVQSDLGTRTQKISSMEAKLNDLRNKNNEEYSRIIGAVDLEAIKKVAMDELGMTYPNENQIVEFKNDNSDYVRQYANVPEKTKAELDTKNYTKFNKGTP